MASQTPNPTPVPVAQISAYAEQQQTAREGSAIGPPEAALISAAITAAGSIAVFMIGQRLILKREREAREHSDRKEREERRRELLEALRGWEQKFVVVTDPVEINRLYYRGGGINEIAAATEKFRGDVADKARYDELNVISGMSPQTMDANGQDQRRETLCDAIRKLIAFVREA